LINSTALLDAVEPASMEDERLLAGGAPCKCPPACARTEYAAAAAGAAAYQKYPMF